MHLLNSPKGARVFHQSMGHGPFGVIHYREVPVRIRINSDVSPMRREVALIHELLHYAESLYKWEVDHTYLHLLAVAIRSRMLSRLIAEQSTGTRDFPRALEEVRSVLVDLDMQWREHEIRTLTSFILDEIVPTLVSYRKKQ